MILNESNSLQLNLVLFKVTELIKRTISPQRSLLLAFKNQKEKEIKFFYLRKAQILRKFHNVCEIIIKEFFEYFLLFSPLCEEFEGDFPSLLFLFFFFWYIFKFLFCLLIDILYLINVYQHSCDSCQKFLNPIKRGKSWQQNIIITIFILIKFISRTKIFYHFFKIFS